jgi:hypothetical protein
MKKIHYQNIEFPKIGTSWLFGRLGNMPNVTKLLKENNWQKKSTSNEQFKIEYLPELSSKLINLINDRIAQTEIITKRNLNHWKNNVKKI